jgi:hypothetical protein
MAQTGYTPIQLYNSSTASATPSAGNLAAGELAINTADGKLFYKDSGGVVQVIASKAGANGDVVGPASATDGNLAAFDGVTGKLIKQAATVTVAQGGTGITSGTSGGIPYFSGTSAITSSAALAANALVIGGGAGVAPSTTTTGTGVVTALGNNVNSTGGFTTIDGTATLTNKNIQSRVVSIADGTSVTINGDTTDIATQANTQALGTLTINAPTGTPFNGQKLVFRLQSTNVQTFSWNAIFAGSTDLTLPTTSSGASKYDYMGFIYNSTAAKWQILAKNFGF